jgi:hypothetical protein
MPRTYSRRTVTKYMKIRSLIGTMAPKEIAKTVGCHITTVYREINDPHPRGRDIPIQPPVQRPQPTAVLDSHRVLPVAVVELRLPGASDCAEVKLRTGRGSDLRGTIVLTCDGIAYRRPNQRSGEDRILSWRILQSLAQIGIALDLKE